MLVIAAITLAGILMRLYVSHQIFLLMDRLFARIPLVKSLYSMFKDLVSSLVGHRRAFTAAVLVNWPDERAQVLGLLTGRTLPREIDPDGDKVAVYLPNTFQFTGVTIIVYRSQVRPCGLSVEDAFKFAISAGLGHGPADAFPGGSFPSADPEGAVTSDEFTPPAAQIPTLRHPDASLNSAGLGGNPPH
ncbi:MAG: DUF502 domain-containing protein [Alicyclobacillus sp.]|nr:DUF502 domain-containing protein [Alicyclobacillus sp.]